MNTTQINAMRSLWENASRPEQTMTAREMALAPASLDRTGDIATMKTTGETWYWSESRNLWTR